MSSDPGGGRAARSVARLRGVLGTLRAQVRNRILPPVPSRPPADLPAGDVKIIGEVQPYSATSFERLGALIAAVRYVARARIPGAIAECGVWRGGSMMAVAKALLAEGDDQRDLYLYDTFEGMTPPSAADVAHDGVTARAMLERDAKGTGAWCYSGLDEVRANMAKTGYRTERIHFIKGRVEDTIPAHSPGPLALLRLDTDWYESTLHELRHLFPALQERGVLIIDDYGHWQGARRATDEFLQAQPRQYYMHRIDFTGRLILKA